MIVPTKETVMPSCVHKVLTHRIAFPALALIVSALGLIPVFLGPLNYDVAWYLYAGSRVKGGATLYVDIIENNPPLIIWLSLLPALLAQAFDVSEILAFHLLMIASILGSLSLSAWVLTRIFPGRVADQRGLILLFLFLLLPFVGFEFGQREHLMLVLTLPYLLAASARATGHTLDGPIPWLLGVMAGVGIVLKPYFVPLWFVIEGYLAWTRRGPRIWLRPETVAVVVVGIVYAGAVLGLTPNYLNLAMSMKPIYAGYYNIPMATLLTNRGTLLAAIVSLGIFIIRPRGEIGALCHIFLMVNICLLGTVFLQQKGWPNHFYPVDATALLLLGLFVVESQGRTDRFSRLANTVLGGVLVCFLLLGLVYPVNVLRGFQDFAGNEKARNARMATLVDEHAKGRSIYLMSDRLGDAFPLVNITGVRWASRFPSLWMLPGIYAGKPGAAEAIRFHPIAAMGDIEQYQFETVISDLLRDPPALLIVDVSPRKPRFADRRFDYLEYFAQDPRFGAFVQNYEPLTDIDNFRVYRQRTKDTSGVRSGFLPTVATPTSPARR